jgi:hypothetical protein
MITGLQSASMAGPEADRVAPHDPVATATAPDPTPWIDLAPHVTFERAASEPPREDHRVAAAATLGGIYAGFIGWTYLAWYKKHKPSRPTACRSPASSTTPCSTPAITSISCCCSR